MSKVVKFTEFGRQRSDIYVVISQISHFKAHCNSRDVGTVISLDNGTEIVVGANPETVRDAIEQAGED